MSISAQASVAFVMTWPCSHVTLVLGNVSNSQEINKTNFEKGFTKLFELEQVQEREVQRNSKTKLGTKRLQINGKSYLNFS